MVTPSHSSSQTTRSRLSQQVHPIQWGIRKAGCTKSSSVNLFGVIHGLNTLLPLTTQSSTPSSIVITGSKQGITNPPGNPAYNASKAAVKTLAEHLSYDLSKSSPSTSVHLLVPGWTFTGLSGNKPFVGEGAEKKEKPKGAWSSEQVVEFLEVKMSEGKFYVICPDNDVSEETDKKRMLVCYGLFVYLAHSTSLPLSIVIWFVWL